MKAQRALAIFMAALSAWITVGCSNDKGSPLASSVWRASNDHGDKPGNGLELTLNGNVFSVRFFVLDPDKPHDFGAGRMFPVKIVERRPRELVCEVEFITSQPEKFILRLPESFPQDTFVATTLDVDPPGTTVNFTFKRFK